MNNSKTSSATSSEQAVQLPLRGFRMPLKSDKPGWEKWIEGMGEGRYRIGMRKIKK